MLIFKRNAAKRNALKINEKHNDCKEFSNLRIIALSLKILKKDFKMHGWLGRTKFGSFLMKYHLRLQN